MKRLVTTLLISLAISCIAVLAVGQDQAPPQEQARADTAQMISGTIKSLDTDQVTVVTADQKEVVFKIDEKTKFMKGDEPCDRSELKQGTKIKAEIQDSKAVSVEIFT